MADKPKKVVIQYHHSRDGEKLAPVSRAQNKVASLAWWYTKGMTRKTADNPEGRWGAAQLTAYMKKQGIDIKKDKFDITLSNGHRITSTLGKILAPVPVPRGTTTKGTTKKAAPRKAAAAKKTSPTTAKKTVKNAPAKRNSTRPKAPRAPRAPKLTAAQRVELTRLAREEGKLIKAWEDGGSVGERPATPNLDNLIKRGPSKGKKAVDQQGVSVKPTNKDRKVPKERAPRKSRAKVKDAPAAAETPPDPRDGASSDDASDATVAPEAPAETAEATAVQEPEAELVSV